MGSIFKLETSPNDQKAVTIRNCRWRLSLILSQRTVKQIQGLSSRTSVVSSKLFDGSDDATIDGRPSLIAVEAHLQSILLR